MRTIKYKNGDVYVGNTIGLFKPEKWGEGTMTYAGGNVYKGEWRNDVCHGKGTLTYSNGDVFVGEWKDGKMTNGRIDYKNGNYYEGEFSGGVPSGDGKLYEKSTDTTYVGHFSSGHKYGVGKETCPEYTYKGRFTMGKFQLEGRLDWKNGDWEEGTFNRGKLDKGKCKRTENDGSVYEGEIVGGLYEGEGSLRLKDGSVYTGQFLRGTYHGNGRLVAADGSVQSGEFVEGKFYPVGSGGKKTAKTNGEASNDAVKSRKTATPLEINKIFSDLRSTVKKAVERAMLHYDKVINPKPALYRETVNTPESVATVARECSEKAESILARFEERSKNENVSGSPLQSASATKSYYDATLGKSNVYRGALNYKGQPHGYGKMEYTNGTVYEGEYEWGEGCGIGRYRNEKYTYTGEFYKSMLNGMGVAVYNDGVTCSGKFLMGKFKCGVLASSLKKIRYEGELDDNMDPHGNGVIYSGGAEVGNYFANISYAGYGYFKSDERVFKGYYSSEDKKGSGVVEYRSGDCYKGEVAYYLPEGYGCYTYKDGSIIVGKFSAGFPHGYCEITDKDGNAVRGWFQNGEIKLKY